MEEESLLRIEKAADDLLSLHGVVFRDDQETQTLFCQAGATLEGERVRFEPGMLREILKTAPRRFTQHGRQPGREASIGGNDLVFAPAYGSPFVMDLDQGRRYGSQL